MRKLFLCLILVSGCALSQNSPADSALRIIRGGGVPDTTLIKLYNFIGEQVYSYQPDSAIRCWEKSVALCEKRLAGLTREEDKRFFLAESSAALNNIGYVYQNTGNAFQAIRYLKRSLAISNSIKDYPNIAIALNNIGHNLANMGNHVAALDYYNQNLEVVIRHGTKQEVINSLIVLGDMYGILQDQPNALTYNEKALKAAEEINDRTNMAYAHTLLGNLHFKFGNNVKALYHDSLSLGLYQEQNDQTGICQVYNNIGARYYTQKNYEKALQNFKLSFAIRQKTRDVKGMHANMINMGTTLVFLNKREEGYKILMDSYDMAFRAGDKMLEWTSLKHIGNLYYQQEKNYRKAAEFGLRSLELARQLGFPEMIRFSAKLLSDTYTKTEDFKKAYEMQALYMQMRDSLLNVETRKATINSQLKYEYELKAAADSVRTAADKKLNEVLLAQERTKGYALYSGLALTVMFGGLMFNRYKKSERQKKIIEQKEKETNFQKDLIQNKNKEILDSMAYAKRLQEAILPPAGMWKEVFRESFILYRPKDIVAGDFYWMEEVAGDRGQPGILFAAADCTGHGVPGAMVSVVCANALTRTVKELKIHDPGEVLDKVKDLVIQTFEKSESEVKDGMDISLCWLNRKTMELKWAGANNPLWILRKADRALLEIRGDKQPVGSYFNSGPFTTHTIQLEPGDTIYIFTDGFADQFGGEKGKKFKSSRMKELLASFQDQPLEQQMAIIDEAFEKWRGTFEQIDDVCVIGVRI